MKDITTCLWFDGQAEDAAKFYTSIFKDSKMGKVSRFPDVGKEIHGRAAGSVMTVEFEVNGRKFLGLNGGPHFKFNEAISFVVPCDTQDEIDYYWNKLSHDPKSEQCGWLKDKFGLSWQINPTLMEKLMSDPDQQKRERTMAAMLKMKKMDIAGLQKAYEGK